MLRDIPCVLMRGGSSKGLYFRAADLPADPASRDRVLLAVMGSPDVRQIDGLGGGDEQSSKVVLVDKSQRPGIDVECLFAQVSVSRDVVDPSPNSGNMLSGVGAFAVEQGLACATDPVTLVRILDLNTGRDVEAQIRTPGGRVTYQGDYALDDLPGTSAPVILRFLEPAGAATGTLLPTGRAIDVVEGLPVSCIDFGNPTVLVAASDIGRTGHESKQELDADRAFLARLEKIRLAAADLMGMGDVAERGLPKIIMLAPARHHGTIASRYFTPQTCHTGHALTGALCVIAACNVEGSVAARIANPAATPMERIDIEHPTGSLEVRCEIAADASNESRIASATVITTARPLFTGVAYVRESAFATSQLPGSRVI